MFIQAHDALTAGLRAMGLDLASTPGFQLWQLNAVAVGLGPLKGKIWRVGLMGENATKAIVGRFLQGLGGLLNSMGRDTDTDEVMLALV